MTAGTEGRDGRAKIVELLRGGVPVLLSSVIAICVPLVGKSFLDDRSYAIWSLLATVLTTSQILDFGVPAFAARVAARREATGRAVALLAAFTSAGSLIIAVLALAGWSLLAWRLGAGASPLDGAAEIAGLTLGTALRGISVVQASVALARKRYLQRSLIYLTGSIAQLLATVVALLLGAGVGALADGCIAGGVLALGVGIAVVRLDPPPESPSASTSSLLGSVLRYARFKGVSTLCGIVVNQMDRWVLVLIAAPSFIATYDIAARLAVAPKIVAIAVSAGLAAQAAEPGLEVRAFQRHLASAVRALLVVMVAGYVVVVGLGAVLPSLLPGLGTSFDLILVTLALGHLAHSLTAPGTTALGGLAFPRPETLYLIGVLGIACVGYAVAIVLRQPGLVVLTVSGSLVIPCVWFVLSQPRWVDRAAVVRG